jgi:hypothetical protein
MILLLKKMNRNAFKTRKITKHWTSCEMIYLIATKYFVFIKKKKKEEEGDFIYFALYFFIFWMLRIIWVLFIFKKIKPIILDIYANFLLML